MEEGRKHPMMKLYWSPRSRSFSALWLMEETGQPYERVLTDISTGAQKTSEFLAPGCIEPAMVQVATKIEMSSVAAGWGDAQRVFDVLDTALTKGPWILGETFSAADIAIGSGLKFAAQLFKMVPSRPSFDRYIDRCAARPAFQRASVLAAG